MTHHAPSRSGRNWPRRSVLQVGANGLLGLSLPKIWASEQRPQLSALRPRAKSVIFLFQWGGPSQLDTFDMKPHAPDTIRSPYKTISTKVPGLQMCEHFPRLAQRADKLCLIRTMTHTMKNHASAGYYALTGHEPPSDDQRLRDSLSLYPGYGSVVDKLAPGSPHLPSYVSYPHVIRDGSIVPGQGASFLGKQHDPFFFGEDPNASAFALPELRLPAGMSVERLGRRRALQQLIDKQTRLLEAPVAAGFDRYYERALSMITTPDVRRAFNLEAEPENIREAYGRTTYGQSCLLARRLVEAGVKFVTVYYSASIGGRKINQGGWDTHGFDGSRMYKIVDQYQHPMTDQTLPTLLDDLENRGLLDETLIVWMGEFGRTPKINKNESRDHWPQCYTALLAGGGVHGGAIYGTSDEHAMFPAAHPVRPDDLAATLFYLLGIDPQTEVLDVSNRPLVIAQGDPVLDIVS